MDDYEYCMYGKVFKYQFKENGNMFGSGVVLMA